MSASPLFVSPRARALSLPAEQSTVPLVLAALRLLSLSLSLVNCAPAQSVSGGCAVSPASSARVGLLSGPEKPALQTPKKSVAALASDSQPPSPPRAVPALLISLCLPLCQWLDSVCVCSRTPCAAASGAGGSRHFLAAEDGRGTSTPALAANDVTAGCFRSIRFAVCPSPLSDRMVVVLSVLILIVVGS